MVGILWASTHNAEGNMSIKRGKLENLMLGNFLFADVKISSDFFPLTLYNK